MDSQAALALAKKINDLDLKIKELQDERDRLTAQFENTWNSRSNSQTINIPYYPLSMSELANIESTTTESISRKIRQVFANSPGEVFSLAKLHAYFPEVPSETLRSTLSRLASKDLIENVERGYYRNSHC